MLQRRSWKESKGNDSKRRQRTVRLQEVTRMCRVDGLKSQWFHSLSPGTGERGGLAAILLL